MRSGFLFLPEQVNKKAGLTSGPGLFYSVQSLLFEEAKNHLRRLVGD